MKKPKPKAEPYVAPPGIEVLGNLLDALYPPMYYAVHEDIEPGMAMIVKATEHTPMYFIFSSHENAKMIGHECRRTMIDLGTMLAPQSLRSDTREREPTGTHPK